MSNLLSLREEFNKLNNIIKQDLLNWDPATKSGMEGAQNKAREQLGSVSSKLAYEIAKNSVCVVFLNKTNDSLVEYITSESSARSSKVFCLDAMSTERRLFNEVFSKRSSPYAFNSDTVSRLNSALMDMGSEIGAQYMASIATSASSYGSVQTKEQAVDKISTLLKRTYDNDLTRLMLSNDINKEVKARLDNDVLLTFIFNVDESMYSDFDKTFGKIILIGDTDKTDRAINLDKNLPNDQVLEAILHVSGLGESSQEEKPKRSKKTVKKESNNL